jgi:hypothetical protein
VDTQVYTIAASRIFLHLLAAGPSRQSRGCLAWPLPKDNRTHPATSCRQPPRGVAHDRRPSQSCRWERAPSCSIIVPRRTNSAHLHRPWRAIYATARASLACAASSRILAAMPRRCGSQPKISKTTPCKVAGARRQGRFGPILDTSGKSAALLHHRTIRQTPVGPPWRAVRCDVGRKSLPTIEVALAREIAMARRSA